MVVSSRFNGSAGNEARHSDLLRRLRIRARHSWNPSVADVIVNTRRSILLPRLLWLDGTTTGI
jgi:hypothetical protein